MGGCWEKEISEDLDEKVLVRQVGGWSQATVGRGDTVTVEDNLSIKVIS